MADYKWQTIDINTIQHPPYWLTADDLCYYAREYTIGRGYAQSETNQLILNYKMSVSCRGTQRWHHKENAIQRFSQELAALLNNAFTVTCIPSSNSKDDPKYDSRFEDTLDLLRRLNSRITIEYPIVRRESVLAKHAGGRRNPAIDKLNLEWVGFKIEHRQIIIVDDVIRSGSGFKACQELFLEHNPDVQVVGVFWARAIDPDIQVQ